MTDTTRLASALTDWLNEEARVTTPERLVHATRTRIAATPQRRVIRGPVAWPRTHGRRSLAMATAIGALVVAIAGLSLYLPRSGPAASPSPSATTSPTPTAVPTLTVVQPYECERSRGTCLGPLSAGVYETTTFVPRVRFSVPQGWSNLYDVPGQYDVRPDGGGQYTYPDGTTFSDRLSIYANPVTVSGTDGAPLDTVGTSATELASWLAARTDIVATRPTPILVGGASGSRLDVSLPAGFHTTTDRCATAHSEPRCVSLFVPSDAQLAYGFGLVGPESAVVYLLDVPSGGTVMFVIDDVDGVDSAGLTKAATPIIESVGFVP